MSSVRPNPPPTGSGGAKVDYNTLAVPSNYVPGLGRGASGFTTRSDIGPARFVPKMQDQGDDKPAGKEEGEAPEEAKFDEFMGNDSGVLAGTPAQYDEEDKEADKVWEGIDNYMDERRREQRDERIRQQLEKYREENPKITEQFRDLKRKLADVADEEWDAIPEIGDYTIKKQTRMQSFAPTPDALLAGAAAANRVSATANDNGIMTPLSGLASVSGTASTIADLKAVGEGRGTVLSLKLDHVSDSVSGQTVVDPKGYLTDLKSMKISTATEISDIKKARLLLKSVVQSNQKHAPGWIAAARLEELAGDLPEARRLAMKGCEECPTSEDVWCEAARLQTADSAKAVLARAVAALPSSVKLWLQAARLEKDAAAKSRVLRKGLERIPASVRLWKAAVELANQDDARVLLSRAVECCPQHVELWLALARLETYEQARKVLNRARMAIPTERAVWITAVKLEEAQGNANRVPVIISRAIASLQTQGVVIDREAWLEEAKAAEKSHPPYVETCRAIIKDVIGMGVEDADRKRTWVSDAEECLRPRRGPRGQEGPWPETARAIYQHALQVFPLKKSIWRRAALLEKHHGSRESLFQLLDRATTCCPQAEVLWLMAAKEHWLANNVEAARGMLEKAYNANPGSEEILLAGFKLEFENGEPERARLILAKARSQDGGSSASERVWMKSAIVERELGDVDAERKLLSQGLQLFPDSAKLWLMLGQLEQRVRNPSAARSAFATGVARCWQSVPLWRCAAALEEQLGRVPKARAILDQARLKNPKTPELWLAAIRTEVRAGNAKEAQNVLARALQDCPSSGLLLAESVAMAPRHARKDRSAQALKRCNQDAHVFAAVAHHFWNDGKVDKARSWFDRAVTLNPDVGDFWAAFYKFECQYGTPESQAGIIERCKKEEPRHGERWCRVAKDPQNAHLATDLILKKVVVDIDTQPPP